MSVKGFFGIFFKNSDSVRKEIAIYKLNLYKEKKWVQIYYWKTKIKREVPPFFSWPQQLVSQKKKKRKLTNVS